MKQYQKRLVVQLDKENDIIRQLVQKGQKPWVTFCNKSCTILSIFSFFSKALLLLRKTKYTEKILDKTDNELAVIENLIMDIEFKNVEQSVLQGIQVGNETLKQLNAVFSIEQIEAIMDESDEAIRKQQVS